MIRDLVIGFCLVAAAAALGIPAQAAEEIHDFDVIVEVQPDGSLEVTETIRVTAEGRAIKRGIYRDFPVEQREDDGRVALSTMKVLSVTRNGQREPYLRQRSGAYARIRIGDKDVFLPRGAEQVYELTYRTTGQLRRFDGFDELYWNVTGDGWAFPIRAASVEVRLPEPAQILQYSGYTGRFGSTGKAYEVTRAEAGVFRARTSETLFPGQGFTIAVAWPLGLTEVPPVKYGVRGLDGFVEPPMTIAGYRAGPFAALLGTLVGAFALFLGWLRVGRDPQGGAVYPQFDPPGGLGPAALRYVKNYGYDPRCLTAAILSMAVKGSVKVIEKPSASLFRKSNYELVPLGESRNLTPGEKAAYRQLFPTNRRLELKMDKTNGKRVDKAKAELRSELWDEHYGASFKHNTKYTVGGVLIGLAAGIVLVGIAERWNALSILQWALAGVAAGLATYAAGFVGRLVRDLVRGGGSPAWPRIRKSLPFLLFVGMFALQAAVVTGFSPIVRSIEPGLALSGAAFGVAAALFHFLMAAPSKAGRQLLDQIAGFELYMRTAEEDRLDILNPPEKTPELFEKLLPHAIALGLAHQWSEKFADVLARVAVPPSWYSGSNYDRFDVDGFERDFDHAVASTSTPPSRSSGSGSGGGGFSGGGGGGGGGGGW